MTASSQIASRRWGGRIRVLETWYDEDPVSRDGFDLWICHQRTNPVATKGWLYFYTLHVDLVPDPEAILAGMRKNTARDIRNADTKDGLTCFINALPSVEDLDDHIRFHEANPRVIDKEPAPRERLLDLLGAGLIHLSSVQDASGRVLARHILLPFEQSRTVQLNAMVSLRPAEDERALGNVIARANRWLIHKEFLFYKERGYTTYDLNGWYAGVTDEKRLKINQFKEGFRGRILFGYDCEEPLTFKGRLYLALADLKCRIFQPERRKDILRRRQKAPRLPDLE